MTKIQREAQSIRLRYRLYAIAILAALIGSVLYVTTNYSPEEVLRWIGG